MFNKNKPLTCWMEPCTLWDDDKNNKNKSNYISKRNNVQTASN